MKKIIAILLSAMMVMMLVVPAFATEADAEEEFVIAKYCLGDVDNNGIISAADARLALRFSVFLEQPVGYQFIWADYNKDGKLLAGDARDILRVSVGLEEQIAHSDESVDSDVAATWLEDGFKGKVCAYCGRPVEESVEERKALLAAVVDDANAWAASAGFDSLVEGNVDLADAKAEIVINVDGIWELEEDLAGASFDGLMTAIGDAVEKYVGDSVVTVVDNTVYKDGVFQNTAIKNALFEIGAGFFFKLANLGDDLVYGTYAVTVDDEAFDLVVRFDGSEENVAKVESFAATVADHISATVVNGDLVIDLITPDALANYIASFDRDLDDVTIGAGLSLVSAMDIESVFGSQTSAVNRLCAVLNSLDGFVNKVLAKVTSATVTTMNGEAIELLYEDASFEPDADKAPFNAFVEAFTNILSDELFETKVGEFENGDYYTVQLDVAVDMSNIGDMVNSTIAETIYINIHVFDDPSEEPEEDVSILPGFAATANSWMTEAGFDSLLTIEADTEKETLDFVIDVDGIWELEEDLEGLSFDGLMTAVGDAFEACVGDADVTVVDKTVYKDGVFQNTAIKNALFEVGAGFFYKLANIGEDLVFGSYAVTVGEEEFTLNIKLAGSEENLAKVKSFSATIAEHIAATVVDGNLVIDVKAPDALANYIASFDRDLDDVTIGAGLSLVSAMDIESVFGSQTSAVNRLCAVLNSLDGFVNKVLAKVTSATVTTMNGEAIELLYEDASFEPDADKAPFNAFVEAFTNILSDELFETKVGEFANGDYYTVQLDIAVDMSNIGDMVNSTITETIYINIHVFDDVVLG